MGKKTHLGTKLFLTEGTWFTFKMALLEEKKGTIWVCPFRGNEKDSRGQFLGSAVAIRAQKLM